MANKPFAIQGADLTLGGVNLQAGTTGVVIPGVTRATGYKVEEVNDNGDQTYQFAVDSEVVVVDAALYNAIVAQGNEGHFADYTATTDGEGYIDEIKVNGQGTYTQEEAATAGEGLMYAYKGAGSASDRPLVPEDWITIPFYPKMRAGEVEVIGGGGNANTGNFTFSDDTITNDNGLILETDRGTLAIGTNMETPGVAQHFHIAFNGSNSNPPSSDLFLGDDYNYVKLPGYELNPVDHGVEIGTHNRDGGSSYNWRFGTDGSITFPDDTVQTTAYTGQGGGVVSGASDVWVQTFESATPVDDTPVAALSVEYDTAGNIIVLIEHTNIGSNGTFYSVDKYTSTGTRIWTTRFGSEFNTDGWGLAVDSTSGFIYVAGKTNTDGGQEKSTLTKISAGGGIIEWSKTYSFGVGINSNSQVVDVASDGNPVIVGYVNNDPDGYVTTTKVNAADGTVIWSRKLDGQSDEKAYGMAVGPSGEIVTVGYMNQLGLGSNNAMATAVTEPPSNVNWDNLISARVIQNGLTLDIVFSAGVPTITVVSDTVGGRIIGDTVTTILGSDLGGSAQDGIDDMVVKVDTVSTADGSSDDHMLVVRYLSDGTIDWQKAILFDAGFDSTGADADIDSNGNIYVCGQYGAPIAGPAGVCINIVKFNGNGDAQWSRRVGGDCGSIATSIVVGPDDKLYLAGTTFSSTVPNPGPGDPIDISSVVAKYNLDGTVEWQRLLDNTDVYSIGSTFFFGGQFGGSNIAVKQDYVAFCGAFGEFGIGPFNVHAMVAQLPAAGDLFTVAAWDFKQASFSGTLNGSASDITVVDAGKTDTDNSGNIITTSVTPGYDSSNFMVGTIYSSGIGVGNQLVNGGQTLTLNANGSVTFPDGSIQTTAYPGESTIVGTYLIHEYSNPTELTEPTTVIIDGMSYGGGEVVTDSAFGPGSSRVTLYADSMFAMVAVNADINAVYYNGETGSDGQGNAKILSNGVSNYRGYYAQYNLISGNDPAIQQIVISKSSTMSGSNRSANTNNDDFTVTGLSGSDVVIVLNVYWNSTGGPTYSVSTTVAVEQFIDLVMFDAGNGDAPRTNINDIQAAFYNNSNAIKTAIESAEGDLLYSGFRFYASFQAVTPTGGSGTGAVLELEINFVGYSNQDVLVSGTGYQVSDTLTVSGILLGGSNPTNNATITVTSVNGTGGIIGYDVGGDSVTNLWPDSYIIDGNNDQYDIGNFIGTDRTRATATVTLATAVNGGEGNPEVFPTLTVLSANKPISEGQWVWFDAQNKGAFINWTLELGGNAISSANQVTITSPFVTDLFGPEVYFIKTNYGSQVDNIDTDLSITRNSDGGGIYNSALEQSYNGGGDYGNGQDGSPMGTQWNDEGWGDLSNVKYRSYNTWYNIVNGGAHGPGREFVMHDTNNDKYYAIKFLTWQNNGNGCGFSYVRKLINTECWFIREDGDDSGYGDEIDTGIKIVRGSEYGIFNDLDEGGWNNDSSPTGTLWNTEGWSDLTNVTTRQYLNFNAICKGRVGKNVCGVEFVMKDTINNNYYAIKFSFWGNSGNNWPGFAYTRRKIDLTKVSSNVKFADGTIQTTAITEQRLGVLPQKLVSNSSPFGNSNDRYLTLDDIGKHLFVISSGITIYITDSVHQQFPVGSVITIINKSGGSINVTKDNDDEGGTIFGSAQDATATSWYINDSGSGNMVTLIKIGQYCDDGNYSHWMIAGTDIGTN